MDFKAANGCYLERDGRRVLPMTDSARLRQACSLAAQLPEDSDDVRAIMGHLQRLVDEFILAPAENSRLSVVAFRKDSH